MTVFILARTRGKVFNTSLVFLEMNFFSPLDVPSFRILLLFEKKVFDFLLRILVG